MGENDKTSHMTILYDQAMRPHEKKTVSCVLLQATSKRWLCGLAAWVNHMYYWKSFSV
jgi:hypothetical protein